MFKHIAFAIVPLDPECGAGIEFNDMYDVAAEMAEALSARCDTAIVPIRDNSSLSWQLNGLAETAADIMDGSHSPDGRDSLHLPRQYAFPKA